MSGSELFQMIVASAERRAFQKSEQGSDPTAMNLAIIEVELARALEVIADTDTPNANHYKAALCRRLATPPISVPRGTLIKGSKH